MDSYIPKNARRMTEAQITAECELQSQALSPKYETRQILDYWANQMVIRGVTPPLPI